MRPSRGPRKDFNPRPPRGERPLPSSLPCQILQYFNPRPPRGERRIWTVLSEMRVLFQSTPSARRATFCASASVLGMFVFQSTPSARRATETVKDAVKDGMISIHALREESDLASTVLLRFLPYFNPRPPRGERPVAYSMAGTPPQISIHALREESDSVHAESLTGRPNFNPRPPRGERPTVSSTARGRYCISIHALREESDGREVIREEGDILFQSTPSARRATLSAENSDEAEIFQSTPSARRATPELRGPCGA